MTVTTISFSPFNGDPVCVAQGRLYRMRGYATTVDPGTVGIGSVGRITGAATLTNRAHADLSAIRGYGTTIAGIIGRASMTALYGEASAGEIAIPINFGNAPIPWLRGTSSLVHVAKTATGDGNLRRFDGFGAPGPVGRGQLRRVTGVGYMPSFMAGASIAIVMSPGYLYTVGSEVSWSAVARAGTRIGSGLASTPIYLIADGAGFDGAAGSIGELRTATHGGIAFSAIIEAVNKALVAESIAFAGDAAGFLAHAVALVESLRLLAGPGNALEARNIVASAIAVNAALEPIAKELLGDGLAFAADIGASTTVIAALLDAAAFNDLQLGTAIASAVIPESFIVDDSPATAGELLSRIQEQVGFEITIHTSDGTWIAWCVNTETRAAWLYENYPFNSFARLAGRTYGAMGDGIYALEGDDDQGAEIAAKIRLGLSNLGTGLRKRVPSMYLGYESNGTLVLKVVSTTPGGEKHENWYRLVPQRAAATREGRIKIGRGIKAVYFDFEIVNVDGADFALSALDLHPLILDRRIGGE